MAPHPHLTLQDVAPEGDVDGPSPTSKPARTALKQTNGRPSITPRDTKASRLRKSMSSLGSPSPTPCATPRARSATPEVNSSGLAFEMTRRAAAHACMGLRDELHAKRREADALEAEVGTLHAGLATKERALAATAAARDALDQRALNAEADLAARTKQLAVAEAERQKWRSEAGAAGRAADKLTAQLAAVPKDNTFSEAVAALQSEAKALREANRALEEDNRACYSQIRAKDKQLDAAAVQVEEARRIRIENGELQNAIGELRRQLGEAAEEKGTLTTVARQREAEVARAHAAEAAANEEAAEKGRQLAAACVQLKAAEVRCAAQEEELAVVGAELARVRAVAARATSREMAGGTKDGGVVPVAMHLEEVRYLQGQVDRLKEKAAQAQRSAAASHALKERLHKRLDALQTQGSPRKPSTPGAGEVAALREELAVREADAAALREQVERVAPRVAAMRAACKKQEVDMATLTAQLRAAGIQPLVSPSASRPESPIDNQDSSFMTVA